MQRSIITPSLNEAVRPTGSAQALASWTQQDLLVAAGLFLFELLTRLPFAGQVLYHWDSVNFAFSLERFDIAAGQPHVPGYILYVYLARLVNLLFGNAQTTLLAISMVSSGLALVFLYRLGSEMFTRTTGLLAALFLGTSPLFWFYGEIALPHTLDALVVIVLVWMLYRVARGDYRWVIPAAIWLGLAGGFRPQTQVFMAPLALYAGWRLGWRRGLAALAVLAVVDLAWFLPLIQNTGGLAGYLHVMDRFSADFNTTTTIFSGGSWGLMRNVRKLGMYSLYGWSLALLPALLAGAARVWPGRPELSIWKTSLAGNPFRHLRAWFFVLWIGPTVVYYLLIHMGQQGLVFVYLPALMLLSAAGVEHLFGKAHWAVAAAIAGAGALIFLLAPTYPLGGDQVKLLTAETLNRHDAYYLPRIRELPARFSPQSSVLLSSNWRFPQYYLPAYQRAEYAIGARWEVGQGLPDVNGETWLQGADLGLAPDSQGFLYLVILDDEILPFNDSAERVESLRFSNGQSLAFIRFMPQEWVYLGPESYGIAPEKPDTR